MHECSWMVVLWLCAVLAVAGCVQGLTGFGLAVICTPLLSLALPVRLSVPIAAICGLFVTLPIVAMLRRHVRWGSIAMLLASSIPGVWLGGWLLGDLPPDWILAAMGVILVGLGLFNLLNGRLPERLNGLGLAVTCGFASGAAGAATAAPGPPLIAYISLQSWDSRDAKAAMNLFFLFQGTVALPVYFSQGLMNWDVLTALPWALSSTAIGLSLGLLISHRLRSKETIVRRVVNFAILGLGGIILARALLCA